MLIKKLLRDKKKKKRKNTEVISDWIKGGCKQGIEKK